MTYLKIVYRSLPYNDARAREYVELEDYANVASLLCCRAIDRQVSPRHILCQVYPCKSWKAEKREWEQEMQDLRKKGAIL